MEVFGTPRPNKDAVTRWKAKWRDTHGKIQVSSFNDAIKLLTESDVDPLFYQFFAEPGHPSNDAAEKYYIVFYKDEHEVFFKLHT